ncbi:MAG: methyltransferase domain-containing protein [Deltaproteobacteria bacterium]|nr:methyltransferase domain-containing protein [Deltaproteobacteria bacterium]MBM4286865.1 methyltransferase domain-containing protein [Deltaproteobacteria bacterium]
MSDFLVRLLGWKATVLHGDPMVWDRYRFLRRHLQAGPLRTLEAGCGSGAFTLYAAMLGNESIGVSFDDANNRKAARRAQLLCLNKASFLNLDLRELHLMAPSLGRFDQIICFETIEHILDDDKLIGDLSSMLVGGGRLILTTPNKGLKPLIGDGLLSTIEDGGHVRLGYTFSEMRELFNANGLDIVVEDCISGYVSQKLTNTMRTLTGINHKLGWTLTFPLRLLQYIDFPLTLMMRYPYYCIGVVGLKRK